MQVRGCPLCETDGGTVIFHGDRFRVVRAQEEGFPAFWRLVWSAHVAEFSDLSSAERHECMDAVASIERAVRDVLQPDKVNLATLGNVVPHLHWHVIARFTWDSRFPAPVWASAARTPDPVLLAGLQARCAAADGAIAAALQP